MTVKRATQRQSKERAVETRFVLWSLRRYKIVVSIPKSCDEHWCGIPWARKQQRDIQDSEAQQ